MGAESSGSFPSPRAVIKPLHARGGIEQACEPEEKQRAVMTVKDEYLPVLSGPGDTGHLLGMGETRETVVSLPCHADTAGRESKGPYLAGASIVRGGFFAIRTVIQSSSSGKVD